MGFIDGNWVDISSFIVAVIYACWHRKKLNITKPFISKYTALDFMNGLSLVPLLLLVSGVFISGAIDAVMTSNKIILSAAGGVALFAILED